MTSSTVRRAGISVLIFMLGFAVLAKASNKATSGSSLSCTVDVFGQVFDEQNTTAYYHNGTNYCSGSTAPVWNGGSLGFNSGVAGDGLQTSTLDFYGFGGWTAIGGVTYSVYGDGQNCGSNCLRALINSNFKILTLDTRGTAGPRSLVINFTQPCGDSGCPSPAGSPSVFTNGTIRTAALLNVYLNSPYTSMAICSSTACPEAQPAFAKLWFDDPNDSSVQWRIDWQYLRILRMSTNTWYVIADACDGGEIAGLSKLIGSRTRPKTVFNGYYEIPFFVTATH